MSQLLKKYFILSFFIFVSCYTSVKATENEFDNSRAIINENLDVPVLYHASFKVFKYNFTGLVVFKYIPDQEHFHVVFLSETGLSIAEFTATNDLVTVIHVLPVADRKSVRKYMSDIIRTITTGSDNQKVKILNSDSSTEIISKGKYGKHCYLYTQQKLVEISYKSSWRKKTTGLYSQNNYPNKISIYKGKKAKVVMKIIENAIK